MQLIYSMHFVIDYLTIFKLLIAAASFVLLTLYGAGYRRLTGVLLTFPILNGVALLSSSDPMRVAETIYQIVLLNCVLFWIAITCVRWIPPRSMALPSAVTFGSRLIAWCVVWVVVASLLTVLHDQISTAILLIVYAVFAAAAMIYSWQHRTVHNDTVSISSQWSTWVVRIGLFTLAFFLIVYVIQAASDQKWAGMVSALPLPGLFALAALSVQGERQMLAIRDTVLLGPLLVVPFNWLFASLAISLPAGNMGQFVGSMALVLAWSVALGCVVCVVPILERYIDGNRPSPLA